MDKKTKIFIGLGMVFAAYVGYAMVEMTDKLISWQTLVDAGVFLAAILCFWGLWRSKCWALKLSWVLALAVLIWGGYLLHFVWTFWLFDEPTLLERLGNVAHPRVSVFVVFPALWFFYFTRPKVREFFGKQAQS